VRCMNTGVLSSRRPSRKNFWMPRWVEQRYRPLPIQNAVVVREHRRPCKLIVQSRGQ
jgi:hypothetical protein